MRQIWHWSSRRFSQAWCCQSQCCCRLQLKPKLFWYRHHPKMHETVSDERSRAENWTDLRKMSMRVLCCSKQYQKTKKWLRYINRTKHNETYWFWDSRDHLIQFLYKIADRKVQRPSAHAAIWNFPFATRLHRFSRSPHTFPSGLPIQTTSNPSPRRSRGAKERGAKRRAGNTINYGRNSSALVALD